MASFFQKLFKKRIGWFTVLIFLVFFGGFFLRLAWLGSYPVGFHSQEALLGYRGKLLANGLFDETGRRLPIIFTSFQGYQLPFPSYFVAVSVKFFGLREWAVRLPFALLGSLGLVAFLGIILELFGRNKRLLIWSAIVMGFSPWAVFLSRTISGTFLLLNLFLLIFWLFLILAKKKKFKMIYILSVSIFLISFILAVSYFRLPGAKRDFVEENFGFFTNPAILNSINQMRGESIRWGSPLLGKLFYNKTFFLIEFFQKLAQHFKPQFYFAAGEANPLHGLTNFGPIFIVFLPCFLWGVWHLFKTKGLSRHKALLLFWFTIGILPSALDRTVFNQEKLIFVFPAMAILIAFPASRFNKRQTFLLAIFLIFNFAFVFYDGVVKEPLRTQREWQFATKQLAEKLSLRLDDYDQVFVSDYFSPDLGPQLLFFLDYPPEKLWSETNIVKAKITPHQWINKIGKVRIGGINDWEIKAGSKGLFFVGPQEMELLGSYRTLKDGSPSEKICYQTVDEVLDLNGEPIYFVAGGISNNCMFKIKK